jgi:hypothetical protein
VSHFDYPVLDGIAPSWADIAVRVSPLGGNLIEIGDIAAIDTGWDVEVGEQREGGLVIKRTTGSVTSEATMTLYASGWQKLLRGIKALAPLRGNQRLISLVHFGVNVQFTPPGADDILEFRIKGCRIIGRKIAAAEGTDAQQVEVPLSPLQVVDVIDGEEIAAI